MCVLQMDRNGRLNSEDRYCYRDVDSRLGRDGDQQHWDAYQNGGRDKSELLI